MNKLQAIEVFTAIAEHGSLTEAAKRLGKSLPTVVRTLATLEQDLGVRLFNRSTRKIALTEEGRVYLDHCARMTSELSHVEGQLRGTGGPPSGLVHITAPLIFGEQHVAPAVADLMAAHPDLQVRLLCVDRVVDLVEEHMDIAVRISPLQDSSLMARRVGEMRLILCAAPNFLARQRPPKAPADLRDQPSFQVNGNTDQTTWTFHNANKPIHVATKGRLICNTVRPAIQACLAGLGYGLFFEYQVVDEVRANRLTVLLPDYEPPPYPVHLVYPHARLLSSRVTAVLDALTPIIITRLKTTRLPQKTPTP